MFRNLLAPIASTLKSRFFHHAIKIMSEKPFNEMSETQIKLINKHMLSLTERETLKSKGYTAEEIAAVDSKTIRLSAMNDIDDGFGMSPLGREQIIDLASRKPSPKLLENYKKMQKRLDEINMDFKNIENSKPYSP